MDSDSEGPPVPALSQEETCTLTYLISFAIADGKQF